MTAGEVEVEHGVTVSVVLHAEADWETATAVFLRYERWWVGAGTGFGQRDADFEASTATEAEAVAEGLRVALVAEGLDVAACEAYEREVYEED